MNLAARENYSQGVMNAVTDKITQLFGRMTDVADYWMYCLPPGTRESEFTYTSYNVALLLYKANMLHRVGHFLLIQIGWLMHTQIATLVSTMTNGGEYRHHCTMTYRLLPT